MNEIKIEIDQLSIDRIISGVTDSIKKTIESSRADNPESSHLTREQTLKILDVHKSTLIGWVKLGKVSPTYIGRRQYFKRSDIMDLLENGSPSLKLS